MEKTFEYKLIKETMDLQTGCVIPAGTLFRRHESSTFYISKNGWKIPAHVIHTSGWFELVQEGRLEVTQISQRIAPNGLDSEIRLLISGLHEDMDDKTERLIRDSIDSVLNFGRFPSLATPDKEKKTAFPELEKPLSEMLLRITTALVGYRFPNEESGKIKIVFELPKRSFEKLKDELKELSKGSDPEYFGFAGYNFSAKKI